MSNAADYVGAARKLENVVHNNLTDSLQLVMSLRERISYMAEYGTFLRNLFPVFRTLLLERIPVSFKDDDCNRLRRIILEILNRLLNKILYNQQDVLRPYVLELLDLATQTLSNDNEENALTCLHIIFNLHKNYRSGVCGICKRNPADAVEKPSGRCVTCWTCAQAEFVKSRSPGPEAFAGAFVQICLREKVQTFLDLVQAIYRRLKISVNGTFQASLRAETGVVSNMLAGNTASTAPSATNMGSSSDRVAGSVADPMVLDESSGASSVTLAAPNAASTTIPTKDLSRPGSAPSIIDANGGLPASSNSNVSTASVKDHSETLLKGMDSFKVLTECPLIVMLLFQLYHEFISSIPAPSGNIPQLVPLMMEGLQLAAPREAKRLQRTRFKEFVACQVKTLSFLTYLLRGFAELMRPYEDDISRAVIALMKACPGEAVSTRRELLVATRHILATDFKRGFFKYIDTMLDDQVLVGASRQSFDALRPLAFSTLADLVHHVRATLKLPQLSWVVHIYCRNIHDASLPVTIQTTSVRLLLNLTHDIFHSHDPDPSKGKALLVKILKTLVHKFDTLRDYMEHVDETERLRSLEYSHSTQGTKRQLAEMMKVRQAIRAEALSSTVVVGVPDTELDKNLYGVVSVEVQAANESDGPLFGNGEWNSVRAAIGPKGSISGTIQDSSLLQFARGVLRQSHDIAMSGLAGSPFNLSNLPSSVMEPGSQLYLGRGTINFTINAATEAGFPRRLCVRRLEIITSRWDESKIKVQFRWRSPSSGMASSSSTPSFSSLPSTSNENVTKHATKEEAKDNSTTTSTPSNSQKNSASLWTEATEFRVEHRKDVPMVLITLPKDIVCSGLQIILNIDNTPSDGDDRPKSKKAAAVASSENFKVALHELRLIGGDSKAVREAEDNALENNGSMNEDEQGNSLDAAALILDPAQLNQKALAQVMRRTGPVTHVAGLGISTSVTGGRVQRLPSSVVGTGGTGSGIATLDSMRDLKGLIKIMMMGLQRNVLWCICNYDANKKNAPVVGATSTASGEKSEKQPYILSVEERELVTKFFQWGLACVHAYIRGLDVSKNTVGRSLNGSGGSSVSSGSATQSLPSNTHSTISTAEIKDILECFAQSFTVLEPHNFRSTIGRQMPLLFDHVMTSPQLFSVAQILLANPNVSATFADVLLSFLVSCLSELGAADPDAKVQLNNSVLRPIIPLKVASGDLNQSEVVTKSPAVTSVSQAALGGRKVADLNIQTPNKGSSASCFSDSGTAASVSESCGGGSVGSRTPSSPAKGSANSLKQSPAQRASILLQFFKIVFGSVAIFPENENMVRQHVHELVLATLRLIGHTRRPIGFFQLLRSLFRSLSGVYGGQFDASYDELRPLLPALVNGLLRLRASASDPKHTAILVELCLTIPARVEHLLPYIPLLTPAVTHALRATGELAKLGLRTLEFWIDQLNPGEIDTGIAHTPQDLSELMIAVCAHLRPSPYPYGTLAIRILGKLGGRNRRFLRELIAMPSSVSAPLDSDSSAELHSGENDIGVQSLGTHAIILALSWDGMDGINNREQSMTSDSSVSASNLRVKDFEIPLDNVIKSVVKLFERLTQLDAASAPNAVSAIKAIDDTYAAVGNRNGGSVVKESQEQPWSTGSLLPPSSVDAWPLPTDVRSALSANLRLHKMHCFRFCIAVLSGLLESSMTARPTSSTEKEAYFSTVIGKAERNADDVIVDLLGQTVESDGSSASILFSEAKTTASRMSYDHSRGDAVLRSLLRALVLAAADTELSGEAAPLLQGAIAHFCGILVSRTVNEPQPSSTLASIGISSSKSTNNIVTNTVKADGKSATSSDNCGLGVELAPDISNGWFLDPFSLNTVLIEMLCCKHQRRADTAMWAIKEVLQSARAIECDEAGAAIDKISSTFSSSPKGSKKMSKKADSIADSTNRLAPRKRSLWGKLVVQDILDRLCRLCREREMRYKEGAYRAIQELCALDSGLAFAPWIIASQNSLLEALLFCLKDHPREVSLLVIDDVVASMNAIFNLCYDSAQIIDPSNLQEVPGLSAIVQTLASHLTSTKVAVRVGVKRALHDLALKLFVASSFRAGAGESAVDASQGMAHLLLPFAPLLRKAILNEGNGGWKKVGGSGSNSSNASVPSGFTSFVSLRPIQQVGILDALTFVLMLPKVKRLSSTQRSPTLDKESNDSQNKKTVKGGKNVASQSPSSDSPKRGRKRGRPSKKDSEEDDDNDDLDSQTTGDLINSMPSNDEDVTSVIEMSSEVLSLLNEVVALCNQDDFDNPNSFSPSVKIIDKGSTKRTDTLNVSQDSMNPGSSLGSADYAEADAAARTFHATHPLNQPTQRGVRKVAASDMKSAIKATTSNDLCIIQACWPAELPLGVQLKMASCRVLHAALKAGGNIFATGGKFASSRSGFIGVFFKFLTGSSELVVDVATNALTFVITSKDHKKDKPLPKDLLQECLKPVLSQVRTHHKNLSRQLLSGLNRLLYLISAYFNNSLGEKLLEHLAQWQKPEEIAALKVWRPGEEPEIAAAIVGLFYLLPISPDFLAPLVTTVLSLEASLHRFAQSAAASASGYASGGGAVSPYREPLLKFLNRHNFDAVAYFLQEAQLSDKAHIDLFQDLLRHPRAGPLRERFISQQGSLFFCQVFFPAGMRALGDVLPEGAVVTTKVGNGGIRESAVGTTNETSSSSSSENTKPLHSLDTMDISGSGVTSDSAADIAPQKMDTNDSENDALSASIKKEVTIASLSKPELAFERATHAAALTGGGGVIISLNMEQPIFVQETRNLPSNIRAKIKEYDEAIGLRVKKLNELTKKDEDTALIASTKVEIESLKQEKFNFVSESSEQSEGMEGTQAEQQKTTQTASDSAKQYEEKVPVLEKSFGDMALETKMTDAAIRWLGEKVLSREQIEVQYQGLVMLQTLTHFYPSFVAQRPALALLLRILWRSPGRKRRFEREWELPLHQQEESRLLVLSLVAYCRERPGESLEVLFELLDVFLKPRLIDYSFLKDFYRDEVALKWKAPIKRGIIIRFLRMLREERGDINSGTTPAPVDAGARSERSPDPASSTTPKVGISSIIEKPVMNEGNDESIRLIKVLALQLIVTPMLAGTFESRLESNREVVDEEIIRLLMRDALDTSALPHYDEALRIELLRLATLLIEHLGRELVDHRKELIKFAWNHLKSEDSTSKQWAYVNVCRFIAVYETPPKIILQVYVALLRAYQPEMKELVKTALDILVPALPRRLPAAEFVKAIKWTRKIMYEEDEFPQLIHMWQLIVRHPALFYSYRQQFVPQMAQVFNRVGRFPNCPLDNRTLAVSLAELIIEWEIHRKERLRSCGRMSIGSDKTFGSLKREIDSITSSAGNGGGGGGGSADNVERPSKVKLEDLGYGKPRAISATVGGTSKSSETMACNSTGISDAQGNSDARVTAASSGTATSRLQRARSSTSNVSEDDTTLQPQMVWVVLDFLVRISLFTAVHKDLNVQKLTPRCIELFGTALKVWDTRDIKLSYFEKLLNNASTQLLKAGEANNASNKTEASGSSGILQGVSAFTPAELSTCLDVLVAMVDSNQEPNDFVVTHIAKIQLLFGPCFKLDELGIQQKLQQLLQLLTRLHPPSRPPQSFVESNFYPHLKDLIERKLQTAITERPDDPKYHPSSAQHANSSHHSSTASVSSSGASGSHHTNSSSSGQGGVSGGSNSNYGGASGLGGTKCSAYPAVQVLCGLCEDSPDYIETHANSLVKLCHRIARDHVTVTTHTARALQGASSLLSDLGPSKMPPRVMATPTMALLAEANFAASAGNYPNPPSSDEALATLTDAVRLLGSAMSSPNPPSSLKDVRKAFFRLVEGLLMQSDNVPLLIVLVDIVGSWVVPPPQSPSPLTPKERINFMSRLMHFPRVPEPSAVPLVGRFLRILQRINLEGKTGGSVGAGDTIYFPNEKSQTEESPKNSLSSDDTTQNVQSDQSGQSSAMMTVSNSSSQLSTVTDVHSVQAWLKSPGIAQHLGRAQMLGLMASDPALRSDFLVAFIRQADREAAALAATKTSRVGVHSKPAAQSNTAASKSNNIGTVNPQKSITTSNVDSSSKAVSNVTDDETAIAAAMKFEESDVVRLIPEVAAEASALKDSMDIDGTNPTTKMDTGKLATSVSSETKPPDNENASAAQMATSTESTLFQRLFHVLKSDWEVLGVRYWLVVAVEALMSSVDAKQPITLHGSKKGSRGGSASLCHLPSPHFLPIDASVDVKKDEEGSEEKDTSGDIDYMDIKRIIEGSQAHLEATRKEVYRLHDRFVDAMTTCTIGKDLFAPLSNLAHADVGLAEELWRLFMPAAWRSLTSEKQEDLVQPLGTLLAKHYLRPCLGLPAPQAMMPAGGQIGKLPAGGYSQLSSSWGWAAHGTGLDIGTGNNGTQSGGALGPAPPPPNVVRSILGVVTELRPVPVLLPDLLSGLASSHNAWHVVLQVMEHQALATVPSERLDWVRCLALVYEELGESDRLRALQQRACAARESHVALSLEAYGHAATAQKLYLELITQENSGRGVGKKLSSFELELWETRWVECARQLAQWPLLCDFSRSVKQHELTMECAWKGHDWTLVRELLRSPSLIAALELGSPRHKLYEIYMSIVDGKFGDVEHHCNQCIQLALHRWSQLPPLATADGAHNGLLRLFHQLVEVHESGQIMLEVSQHTRNHQHHQQQQQILQQQGQHHQQQPPPIPPDFKYIIHTWRNRLPNKWDPIPEWDDLFCWRHWVFKATSEAFRQRTQENPQQLLRLHDTPWTVLKLAHTARKLRLEDVALSSLSRLYDTPHMDVSDVYTKLREQILMCHPYRHGPKGFASHGTSMSMPVELTAAKTQQMLRGGLSLVNNTNLEYFNDTQRAELFRLKGTFLALLQRQESANRAYSHAAQIGRTYGKNWLAWGEYCHELFLSTHILTYAQQGIGCYLQSLQFCNSTKKAGDKKYGAGDTLKLDAISKQAGSTADGSGGAVGRLVVARILQLLSFDDQKQSLALTFEMYAKHLPAAIWLPWISILLSGLVRPEAPQIRSILVIVGQKYPQALYYSLRAFLLERRESSQIAATDTLSASTAASTSGGSTNVTTVEGENGDAKKMDLDECGDDNSKSTNATNGRNSISENSSLGSTHHANELMSWLRRGHLGLVTDMESMLEEIILCFRPEPEEELLSAIHALLMKCYQITHMSLKDPLPENMPSTLHRVYRKFFHSGVITRSSKPNHKRFIAMFRDAFERDFASKDNNRHNGDTSSKSDNSSTKAPSPLTLMDVVQRLRKWRHVLQTLVHRVPLRVPLSDVAPRLAALWNDYDLPSASWNALGVAAAVAKSKLRARDNNARGGASPYDVGDNDDVYARNSGSGDTGAGYTARVAIEIPGQYFRAATSSVMPRPELHTKLVRFGSYVHMESRAAALSRRLTMLGSDGKARYWLVQMSLPHITRRDERMAHMTMVLNDMLARNPQTRRRNVSLSTLTVVPITPRMRLLEDDPTFTTLHDVYEAHCAAEGTDPDAELVFSREQLARIPKKHAAAPHLPSAMSGSNGSAAPSTSTSEQATASASNAASVVNAADTAITGNVLPGVAAMSNTAKVDPKQAMLLDRQHAKMVLGEKMRIYTEICQRVPDDLLSRHVHAALKGDAEALWALKRALAMQLATASLLCHAFTAGDRGPQRFVFSKRTGRFIASEFRPVYRPEGQMEPSEEVPFRLTRNIMTLLSPLLVDGVFASSMATAALAISEKSLTLKPYLTLILRDDLLSWQASKTQPQTDIEQCRVEEQLSERVNKNVKHALDRVQTAAPRLSHSGGRVHREHRVDHIAHRLIEAAAQPERLCSMPPLWMPWL